jgi:hypothetical protein
VPWATLLARMRTRASDLACLCGLKQCLRDDSCHAWNSARRNGLRCNGSARSRGVRSGFWLLGARHDPGGWPDHSEIPSRGGPDEFIKQRRNNWTVGLVGGAFDGGYLRLADELGKAVDDGDQLRVIPVITHGAAGNL